jgi:SanA protein
MKKRNKIIVIFALIIMLALTAILFLSSPFIITKSQTDKIYTSITDIEESKEVAIVFGAGIKENGEPSDMLADRLISASELYLGGFVEKILVSGDNSIEDYNEPEVMADYLMGLGIPDADVAEDYAGRRTYDTCARAAEIWQMKSAVLVTQEYHLPRAIFTCESFEINSIGYSADRQQYVLSDYYEFREILALYKAVLDVFILRPNYIGGEVEDW